ncbi:hypothetical protein E0Z10_g6427 [Xylaria hypoxylon]|uniref:Uncharacterized protein n=1 Tax=Xylaria hypoxylon TaxID=37992 RepID=A0A4Z0YSG8_9PEZI|nr:hypothetical protein E0Z10_g6427 [Xylaria hypoxylon]
MHDQRVACGWRADEVPEWAESAKRGGKIFYWAVLAKDVPNRNTLLAQHVAAHPKVHKTPQVSWSIFAQVLQETEPLRDTAAEIRLAPRQPTGKNFMPVGHVALDVHDAKEDVKLGLPPGTVWVHQLYISSALQGGGYGVATMAKVESIAAQEPMNGKWMALDTLAKEVHKEVGDVASIDVGRGNIIPVVTEGDSESRGRAAESLATDELDWEKRDGGGSWWELEPTKLPYLEFSPVPIERIPIKRIILYGRFVELNMHPVDMTCCPTVVSANETIRGGLQCGVGKLMQDNSSDMKVCEPIRPGTHAEAIA